VSGLNGVRRSRWGIGAALPGAAAGVLAASPALAQAELQSRAPLPGSESAIPASRSARTARPRVSEALPAPRVAVAPAVPGPAPWSALGSLSVGRGLRFNNPYRLESPLGDTAESLSLAATYLDLGLALLIGERDFRHGVLLGGGVALQGIGQFVLTPSYVAQFGLTDALDLRGRVGVPLVVAPDTTLGLEAGFGSSLALAYGVGALVELVGSVFFGAATDQTSITTIPMLSLQIGLFFEHQVSP
jgi:hypothetical protein